MTELTPTLEAIPTAPPVRNHLVRTILRNPLGLYAVIVLALVILMALIAPLLAPFDPNELHLDNVNMGPSSTYLLGGDSVGRDILSRLIWSSRNTLIGALIGVSVASSIGMIAGLVAGYYGKVLDAVFSWVASILMALPTMIVLLAVFQAVGAQIMLAMVAFGVMLSPGFFRLVRQQVMSVKNELYVDAARVSGLTDWRIIGRHILLVIRAPLIIQASHVAGIAIVMQSGLEFLGLGDPKSSTWGGMLQNAFQSIYNAQLNLLWPGLAIGLTVSSFMLLGNAIRDTIQRTSTARVRRPRKVGAVSTQDPAAATPPAETLGAPLAAASDPDVLLAIRNLTVGYPKDDGYTEVVKGVSLDVRRGEVLGLVGESGSGKTQTAFATLGLLPQGGTILHGSIALNGEELVGLDENGYSRLRGTKIAYVPQEPMSNLDPCFRVGYQLVEPIRAQLGLSAAEAKDEALRLLKRVGIPQPERAFNSYPHEISGGMAQRVLIAGAVSCRPDLLIADEPTTALDVTVQAEVLDLLRDLQAEYGMSVLLVTHNFGVVADICHRIAVMQLGRIVEYNNATSLFDHPQHPYTRMLLESTLEHSVPRPYHLAERVTE